MSPTITVKRKSGLGTEGNPGLCSQWQQHLCEADLSYQIGNIKPFVLRVFNFAQCFE